MPKRKETLKLNKKKLVHPQLFCCGQYVSDSLGNVLVVIFCIFAEVYNCTLSSIVEQSHLWQL